MQTASVQQKTEECPTAETEIPFWALNEVSRAHDKPITNCTFHALESGGCEGREEENPGACHPKLIELSHAGKTLVINPAHLNKGFTAQNKKKGGGRRKNYDSNFILGFLRRACCFSRIQ